MLTVKCNHIVTMSEAGTVQGSLLVDQGRIFELIAGEGNSSFGQVLDYSDRVIIPGLVDAHTHLGLMDEIFYEDDANESGQAVTPELRALDGINPQDEGFIEARSGGVTTVCVAPGSANVIGGQAAVIKTTGRVVDQMVMLERAGLKVALGENPKRSTRDRKEPLTRMGTAAQLRSWLNRALKLAQNPGAAASQSKEDIQLEPLMAVLNRQIKLMAHAHRADDMATALRIAREFGVDLILTHGTDAHLLVEELKEASVPVIYGPTLVGRSKVELRHRSFATPRLLHENGIKFALTTDHPVIPAHYLLLCAALAVREGLPEEAALRSVTLSAAEILGIEDRVGSLATGKDADFVVLNGPPLDWRTRVEQVYIQGVPVL